MATIRKRNWVTTGGEPRERWQVDFVDQNGRRRHRQFVRKKDADAWLVATRGQVAQGVYTPDSASATLAEALDLWLERAAAEGLEPGTLDMYRQHRDHILAVLPGHTRLARLSEAQCEQARDALLTLHSRAMARKVLGSLKGALKDAMRRKLIARNPAAATSIRAGGRHRRKLEVGVDVPTPGQVKALIAAAEGDPKAKALVCLAALAGLRASELRGLRWSDLTLGAKPFVTIAQRADARARIGSPKSASSRRAVPLGETAARALREWKLAQPPGRTLVFGTASDRPDMLGNLTRRLLAPLEAAAGVRRYGWHSLRHYAVSAWLRSGIDPKTAQLWAGHATLALTFDTYGHAIPSPDDHARIAAAETLLG
jgi:integrase